MTQRILTLIVIFLVLDLYVWFGTRNSFSNTNWAMAYKIFYISSAVLGYIGLSVLFIVFRDRSISPTFTQNVLMGFSFAFFVFKLVAGIFLIIDDVVRLMQYVYNFAAQLFKSEDKSVPLHERRQFIVKSGLALASIPFASMLFGITKGKYWYTIKNIPLTYKSLPKSFSGFRVVQISDVHAGSFDSKEDVARGIKMINDLNPDVILFTGDLVNNKADEIEPYINLFSSLNAKYGKFSTLGNHDYGDYVKWESDEAKQANMDKLFGLHKKMGFDLLNNENRQIHKDGEFINIIGVENWGRPPFPQHGDLDQALVGVQPEEFNILMSHDPTHWSMKVIENPMPIELTLSGHTHGMQFGVEIPGWKWSPVKYIYKNWAGLYEKDEQKLYVNRGFGFLGFPGRVGMWPEITLIELS
ncbi:metallophosphoesterase [Flavobacteriaceae bacterium]|nr:metallophosphoesterase [Flavobacteriaceae bacterium]